MAGRTSVHARVASRPLPSAADDNALNMRDDNVDTEAFSNLRKLKDLRIEHRDLDDVIMHMQDSGVCDDLQLKRLKKRKLMLKDEIERLQSELIPDLNA